MKATGEVMGIDRNLERALLKAIHSLEIKGLDLQYPLLMEKTTEELETMLAEQTDERFFILLELIRRGTSLESLHEKTKIDYLFLNAFFEMISLEQKIAKLTADTVSKADMQLLKEKGFSDEYLSQSWQVTEQALRNLRKDLGVLPVYKMVDTCAAEFAAQSNYFYSSYFGENEQVKSQ